MYYFPIELTIVKIHQEQVIEISNDYDNIENAKIKLDLADGLYVTGIKTPKDLGTVYNNIGNAILQMSALGIAYSTNLCSSSPAQRRQTDQTGRVMCGLGLGDMR